MSDLGDFVLDFCRALGGVVEPPVYGVHEVLLPDSVAAHLGVEAFQRWAFDEQAASDGVTRLSHGHPVVERLADLACAAPACARFYLNAVRLDKSGLFALARAALAFPNATLVEDLHANEARALFHTVRFNFKAALLSDEKRERLVSVLIDAQSGATVPEFAVGEALRLEDAPAFTALPDAPVQWMEVAEPLAPAALRALLDRAAQAAAGALGESLTALQQRAARLLELDRARLDAYYAGLERDLERRLKRAEDETKRAALEDKLAATRADHAAKLADAEAKYRVRVELELINLAIVTQPKMMLPARVENRQAGVACNLVWDPLRHQVEPLMCQVCRRPSGKLFLCANNHLACEHCLAPQCVDCKRVYCRACAHEVTRCAVCGRPVCQKSLSRCRECGQGTCREHVSLCHAPPEPGSASPAAVEAPPPEPATPARARALAAARLKKAAPAAAKRPTGAAQPALDYRLEVEVRRDEALVIAFVLTKGDAEVAQRLWQMTGEGIRVACFCEKGWRCPSAARLLPPEPAARIEAQIEAEIDRFRGEYRIPPYRAAIYTEERGEFVRLPRLRLRGNWKDPEVLTAARSAHLAAAQAEAQTPPIEYPDWVLAFTRAEADHFMPEIDRFVHIAYGWLVIEGALDVDELAAMTAAVAQPGAWYTPERARDLFKADPSIRMARKRIVFTDRVRHPLKVLQAKAARGLPPRPLTAAELLAAADGPAPLTSREAEIEQILNRRAGHKLFLRSVQTLMRQADHPSELLSVLLELCAPQDEPEARLLKDVLSELWNHTERYELRGRTPSEVREMH